jgi:putative nucleotidyltransferase with HDIG domain
MEIPAHDITAFLLAKLREVIDPAAGAWLVGGVVRDQLAGQPCHDIDLIFPEDPRKIARLAADELEGKFFTLDETRGIYRVLLEHEGQSYMLDMARFQAPSLEDDLKARDFTINAMAVKLHEPGNGMDPLHGRQDLKDNILRTCSDDTFTNDPVRVIRAARMSLGFNLRLAPGMSGQIRAASPLLDRVSAERKRDELLKLLDGPKPASGLRLLDAFDVLPRMFPELMALKGMEQSLPHTMDGWEHTLAVVSNLDRVLDLFLEPSKLLNDGGNLMLGLTAGKLGKFRDGIQAHYRNLLNPFRTRKSLNLLAALLHDVAKPQTRAVDPNGRSHFYRHEVIGADMVRAIVSSMAFSEAEVNMLALMTANHMKPRYFSDLKPLPDRRNVYRYFKMAGEAGVDTCFLSLADSLAKTNLMPQQDVWSQELDKVAVYLKGWFDERDNWIAPERLVNGNDLMQIFHLQPGPALGDILDQVNEARAAGEINSRDEALELIRKVIARADGESQDGKTD